MLFLVGLVHNFEPTTGLLVSHLRNYSKLPGKSYVSFRKAQAISTGTSCWLFFWEREQVTEPSLFVRPRFFVRDCRHGKKLNEILSSHPDIPHEMLCFQRPQPEGFIVLYRSKGRTHLICGFSYESVFF